MEDLDTSRGPCGIMCGAHDLARFVPVQLLHCLHEYWTHYGLAFGYCVDDS